MEDYLGSIILFAGKRLPSGYLPCNGKILFIDEYEGLYSLLKNRFGGDGITTFALPSIPVPNGLGRFIICVRGTYPVKR